MNGAVCYYYGNRDALRSVRFTVSLHESRLRTVQRRNGCALDAHRPALELDANPMTKCNPFADRSCYTFPRRWARYADNAFNPTRSCFIESRSRTVTA